MTKHFFLTFFRNLRRHPGYSAVNILGLAIGISCAWVIFQYTSFENSYDSFHTDSDKIFKVYPTMEYSNSPMFFMNTPIPLGKSLLESYPEIDKQVSTISYLNAKIWPSEKPELTQYAEDFHFSSLKYGINPLIIFGLNSENVRHVALKLQGGNIPQTLRKLEQVWQDKVVGEPFTYSFLEDRIERLYQEERTFASLIQIFSSIAICIGCIGLLALVAFSAEVRSKEIGIRKVLGASIGHILTLLNRSYFMLIGGSFIVAIPLTIWLMQRWLDEFAYRINLHPTSFLWAGGILMGFTLLTVSYYSLRAALADPVWALKDE